MKHTKRLFVTFQKEGLHRYPAAIDDPRLATGGPDDVSFLGYLHRHIFHFRVEIEVVHADRDIEFIQFKRWLESLYADKMLSLDFKSCEMIADDLHEAIVSEYGKERDIVITVSEDNENGAICFYPWIQQTKDY